MMVHYPKIRVFVEDSLQAGVQISLSPEQSHYLLQVMRLKEGEPLAVFNGRDGEWLAFLMQAGKKKAECRIESQRREQMAVPDIWYVFAPIKHGRIDFIAQKAAELGVSALVPVITQRTIVTRVNEERLLANAVEAAEQCERLDVPEVKEAVALEKLLGNWPDGRILLYGDEAGQGKAPQELFTSLPEAEKWAVLIGPEGGFTDEEFARLRNAKFAHAISLGPRVLRADTAGLAALTCLQAWRGDWVIKPDFKG